MATASEVKAGDGASNAVQCLGATPGSRLDTWSCKQVKGHMSSHEWWLTQQKSHHADQSISAMKLKAACWGYRATVGQCWVMSVTARGGCSTIFWGLLGFKINDIPSLIYLRAGDGGSPPYAPLEKEEEHWCSLYLCSRLFGLIIVILCKTLLV